MESGSSLNAKFWQELQVANPGLAPTGLRHGCAYRMHKSYDRPLSIRDAVRAAELLRSITPVMDEWMMGAA